MKTSYKNWEIDKDGQNIIWLTINCTGDKLNYLTIDVFDELEQILDFLEREKNVSGLILRSGKETDFILGMDLNLARGIHEQKEDKKAVYDLTLRMQKILDRLESLPYPTAAIIKGFAIGGGFEVALALKYRIADIADTKVGLPETKLGINPNWGGIYRLPRLIGGIKGMDLILTGRFLSADKALKYGCIDAAVPEDELQKTAIKLLLENKKSKHPTFLEKISNTGLLRPILAKLIEKKLRKKVNPEHYPAHYKAVNFWRKYGVNGSALLREKSAENAADVFYSETCKNLFRVYFLQQDLKKLGKEMEVQIKHVHVIGAGVMGGDIAAWTAMQGFTVSLQDREMKFIEPALARAKKLFDKKIHDPEKKKELEKGLVADVEGVNISKADLVIEAVYEDKSIKKEIYKKIEDQLKPSAILATNTSSIPLEDLGADLKDKGRFIGLHFFNPVAVLPLVEVIHGESSSQDVIDQGLNFIHKIRKLPLPVKSDFGFLVNRILVPYNEEAFILYYEERVPGAYIDQELVDFGMPMGPIELSDHVGLDITLSVAQKFKAAGLLKSDFPPELIELIEQGNVGRKSGKGIYQWRDNKAMKPTYDKHNLPPDIQDRIILRLLNECVLCLRKKIVTSEELIDAGAIFGVGFAPFRGGPMKYAHDRGINNIIKQLELFTARYGERFKPDAGWKLLAEE